MDALLISRREAAIALGVCLRTLDYLIARGELPARRLGRRILIPRSALEQFVRRDHASPAPAGSNSKPSHTINRAGR